MRWVIKDSCNPSNMRSVQYVIQLHQIYVLQLFSFIQKLCIVILTELLFALEVCSQRGLRESIWKRNLSFETGLNFRFLINSWTMVCCFKNALQQFYPSSCFALRSVHVSISLANQLWPCIGDSLILCCPELWSHRKLIHPELSQAIQSPSHANSSHFAGVCPILVTGNWFLGIWFTHSHWCNQECARWIYTFLSKPIVVKYT